MPQIVTSVSSSLKAQKSFLMRWTRRSSMRHPSPSSKRSTLSTTSSASAQRPQCLDCQIQASSCSSIQNYCQVIFLVAQFTSFTNMELRK
ncbi:hypothetical protein JHK82_022560 [Glycine max]|nr:hypothetical protein JHK82_022560 [Glycine max]